MSIIKIFANGFEIDFKKDSLNLKKENNSLSTDFKVTHSSFPFLVIENETTKKALGSSDVTSINKKKIIPVIVLEFGVKYYGELQQISIQRGYRKCNLKYSSEVLTIISKQIKEFMPVVSVIPGETNPIPYSENSTGAITGADNWQTFPVSMIGQIYPDVKFQFPMMFWKNKFGVNLGVNDTWYLYDNHINNFIDEDGVFSFKENSGEIVGVNIDVENYNVPAPQVFLVSPLFYVFESIGWNVKGSFIEHELIQRTLMTSFKNNLTKTILRQPLTDIVFDLPLIYNDGYYRMKKTISVAFTGKYLLKWNFEINHAAVSGWLGSNQVRVSFQKVGFLSFNHVFSKTILYHNGENYIISGEMEVNLNASNSYEFTFRTRKNEVPINYSLTYVLVGDEKEFNQMHPTIDLGRYVPEWTVGNYLNYLKNQFNLDVALDDFKKEITLNLNENIDLFEQPVVLDQSLALSSFDLAANSSFVLKYENDEDEALLITKNEVVNFDNNADDFTKTIETKFKQIPRNGYTSELSEDIQDKEGIGLMIYEPTSAPFTSEFTQNNFHLGIPGTKGIYETFFKRWLKFRLNASRCEIQGYFTEIEIAKIYKFKAIYVDNQRYRIDTIEYNEDSNNYYSLKMILESVNY